MQIALAARTGLDSLGLPALGDSLAVWAEGDQGWLICGGLGSNGVSSRPLGDLAAPGSGVWTAAGLSAVADGEAQPGRGLTAFQAGGLTALFSFADPGSALAVQWIGPGGAIGAAQVASSDQGPLLGVTSVEILGGAAGSEAVLSFRNQPGFALFGLDATGALTLETQVGDSLKTYLGNVSDTLSVRVGGQNFLITASSAEGGITSFATDGHGHVGLVDALGTLDGLPLAGAAAMQAVTEAGISYVVVASTLSSALTVVRVNAMGCLFATDTVYDDRTTRFAHPQALDSFSWAGRNFIVAAGTDAGVSVMELRPDGKLMPVATGVFETGAGMGAVTALRAVVHGATLDVYGVDAGHAQLLDFRMDLSGMAGMVAVSASSFHGTGKGELVWGGAGAQALDGGGGEDWIFDGAGQDTLTGGSGADVFILAADGAADRITDFELHKDRIDLGDWAGLHAVQGLNITPTADGATIAWGDEVLTLVSSAGAPLSAASFTDADFIFR